MGIHYVILSNGQSCVFGQILNPVISNAFEGMYLSWYKLTKNSVYP